jgi:hypothetical protein
MVKTPNSTIWKFVYIMFLKKSPYRDFDLKMLAGKLWFLIPYRHTLHLDTNPIGDKSDC